MSENPIIDDDVPEMALAVIPDSATGEIRRMLVDAVSVGIMMERERHHRTKVEAAFESAIAALRLPTPPQDREDKL